MNVGGVMDLNRSAIGVPECEFEGGWDAEAMVPRVAGEEVDDK